MDKLLKVEEIIDGKHERITQLEKELQRSRDEVDLRKEVIESMSTSFLKHEKENRELVSKLVMLKNQILENDIGMATDRTFGAVKVVIGGGSKKPSPLPVAVRNFTSH
jgi:chromosome segregation ATPase